MQREKENNFNRCQSEKKKTTLTDANRKKENSFNRCQSEKLNNQKIWISKRLY